MDDSNDIGAWNDKKYDNDEDVHRLCNMRQVLIITIMMITTIAMMMNKDTLQLWPDRPQEQHDDCNDYNYRNDDDCNEYNDNDYSNDYDD